MTDILLSIIAGVLVVHTYFTHAVNKDGSTDKRSDWLFICFIVIAGVVCYGIAHFLASA